MNTISKKKLISSEHLNYLTGLTSRYLHTKPIILGIESSCDDTGSAIVTSDRNILGECLFSQRDVVLRHGGVMPLIAKDLHKSNIQSTVEHALNQAGMTIHQVDAVAVTVKPGLAMSITIGLEYAKQLCKNSSKLLIPIHHMEAHALTIRLFNKDVEFPFLTYLISGGHCLLAVVHETNKFSLLGESIDDAPGEIFDKVIMSYQVARRLRLHNCSQYRNSSGGAAIEDMAQNGNPFAFLFSAPLQSYKNCNFSFSGMKSQAMRYIETEERRYEIEADGILPSASDLCASFQLSIARHLCWRLQRAIEYIESNELLPPQNRSLVVSGGTACNGYIRKALSIVCCEMGYTLYAPPPKYCTDNGTMIAWNGIEKYLRNIDIFAPEEIENIVAQPRCQLGENLCESVEKASIKCKWIKFDRKLHVKDNLPVN